MENKEAFFEELEKELNAGFEKLPEESQKKLNAVSNFTYLSQNIQNQILHKPLVVIF